MSTVTEPTGYRHFMNGAEYAAKRCVEIIANESDGDLDFAVFKIRREFELEVQNV